LIKFVCDIFGIVFSFSHNIICNYSIVDIPKIFWDYWRNIIRNYFGENFQKTKCAIFSKHKYSFLSSGLKKQIYSLISSPLHISTYIFLKYSIPTDKKELFSIGAVPVDRRKRGWCFNHRKCVFFSIWNFKSIIHMY